MIRYQIQQIHGGIHSKNNIVKICKNVTVIRRICKYKVVVLNMQFSSDKNAKRQYQKKTWKKKEERNITQIHKTLHRKQNFRYTSSLKKHNLRRLHWKGKHRLTSSDTIYIIGHYMHSEIAQSWIKGWE